MPIEGLHKCQPRNTPLAGDVKKFVLEQIPARDGKKAWLKITNDNEGAPYVVISVKQAFGGKPDNNGNLAFNLEIEPQNGTQSHQDAPQRVQEPQWIPLGIPKSGNLSREDYWTIKDERDREREARFVANQPRIERQHSQHMMMLYFAMRPKLLEACEDAKQAQTMMREVTDHFQKDIGRSPLGTGTVVEEYAPDNTPDETPF